MLQQPSQLNAPLLDQTVSDEDSISGKNHSRSTAASRGLVVEDAGDVLEFAGADGVLKGGDLFPDEDFDQDNKLRLPGEPDLVARRMILIARGKQFGAALPLLVVIYYVLAPTIRFTSPMSNCCLVPDWVQESNTTSMDDYRCGNTSLYFTFCLACNGNHPLLTVTRPAWGMFIFGLMSLALFVVVVCVLLNMYRLSLIAMSKRILLINQPQRRDYVLLCSIFVVMAMSTILTSIERQNQSAISVLNSNCDLSSSVQSQNYGIVAVMKEAHSPVYNVNDFASGFAFMLAVAAVAYEITRRMLNPVRSFDFIDAHPRSPGVHMTALTVMRLNVKELHDPIVAWWNETHFDKNTLQDIKWTKVASNIRIIGRPYSYMWHFVRPEDVPDGDIDKYDDSLGWNEPSIKPKDKWCCCC